MEGNWEGRKQRPIVVNACNLSMQEAEARGSHVFKGQAELYSKSLSQKPTEKKKKARKEKKGRRGTEKEQEREGRRVGGKEEGRKGKEIWILPLRCS